MSTEQSSKKLNNADTEINIMTNLIYEVSVTTIKRTGELGDSESPYIGLFFIDAENVFHKTVEMNHNGSGMLIELKTYRLEER